LAAAGGWDEKKLESALFGAAQPRAADPAKAAPDFAAMHEQKQRHRRVTLQLLREEYKQANPEGYGYSRFCGPYQRWRNKLDCGVAPGNRARRLLQSAVAQTCTRK
jgi:transposase